MKKLVLLGKRGNPDVVQILEDPVDLEPGWQVHWESPPIPWRVALDIRAEVLRRWPEEHMGRGRFALPPERVQAAVEEWIGTDGDSRRDQNLDSRNGIRNRDLWTPGSSMCWATTPCRVS
jgi:hypothetical protein